MMYQYGECKHREQGEQVGGLRLNSGHVSHHLKHTVEYWREVGRFMNG